LDAGCVGTIDKINFSQNALIQCSQIRGESSVFFFLRR